jgi:hypothetical protein
MLPQHHSHWLLVLLVFVALNLAEKEFYERTLDLCPESLCSTLHDFSYLLTWLASYPLLLNALFCFSTIVGLWFTGRRKSARIEDGGNSSSLISSTVRQRSVQARMNAVSGVSVRHLTVVSAATKVPETVLPLPLPSLDEVLKNRKRKAGPPLIDFTKFQGLQVALRFKLHVTATAPSCPSPDLSPSYPHEFPGIVRWASWVTFWELKSVVEALRKKTSCGKKLPKLDSFTEILKKCNAHIQHHMHLLLDSKQIVLAKFVRRRDDFFLKTLSNLAADAIERWFIGCQSAAARSDRRGYLLDVIDLRHALGLGAFVAPKILARDTPMKNAVETTIESTFEFDTKKKQDDLRNDDQVQEKLRILRETVQSDDPIRLAAFKRPFAGDVPIQAVSHGNPRPDVETAGSTRDEEESVSESETNCSEDEQDSKNWREGAFNPFSPYFSDPSTDHKFMVRGERYCTLRQQVANITALKIPAGLPIMRLLDLELLEVGDGAKRIDHIVKVKNERMRSKIDSFLAADETALVFVLNIQVPGDPPLSLVVYFGISRLVMRSMSGLSRDEAVHPALTLLKKFLDIPSYDCAEARRHVPGSLNIDSGDFSSDSSDNKSEDQSTEEENDEDGNQVSDSESLSSKASSSHSASSNQDESESESDEESGDDGEIEEFTSQIYSNPSNILERFHAHVDELKRSRDPIYLEKKAAEVRDKKVLQAVTEQTSIMQLLEIERIRRQARIDLAAERAEVQAAEDRYQQQLMREARNEIQASLEEGESLERRQKKLLRKAEKEAQRAAKEAEFLQHDQERRITSQLRDWERRRMRVEIKRLEMDKKRSNFSQSSEGEFTSSVEEAPDCVIYDGVLPKNDFRNLRFKLIPQIKSGPWVVKAAVSSTPGELRI